MCIYDYIHMCIYICIYTHNNMWQLFNSHIAIILTHRPQTPASRGDASVICIEIYIYIYVHI